MLRGESETILGWARSVTARRVAGQAAVVVLGTFFYGASIGWWRSGEQAVYTGIKLPLILLSVAAGNALLNAMLAPLLHEDPRYFRKGPGSTIGHRIEYAISRVVITRRDSGKESFNFSGVVGMELGIALSNAYYPPQSVNGREMAYRTFTSLTASGLGNLLSEFWPDVETRFARNEHQ